MARTRALTFSSDKRRDLLVMFGCILAATILSLLFRTTLFTSFLLYLFVPAVYLCWRKPKNYTKIFLAATTLIILGISLDVIAEHNHAWAAPVLFPLLSFTLWNIVPLELVVWGFCVGMFTLIFYEHFLDDERRRSISKRSTKFFLFSIPLLCYIGFVATFMPQHLGVRYAYVVLFAAAELPLLGIVLRRPTLLYKILWLGLFFFVLNLVFELTALHLGQWTFPGQYVGWVNVLGLRFPWEELILWIALSSPTVIFYYETFFDDGK